MRNKLVNWNELSRLLAGHRSSITEKRIPKIHEAKIKELTDFVGVWVNSIKKGGKNGMV